MSRTSYVSNSEFTAVYSLKAISSEALTEWVLPKGTLMTDEAFSCFYSTPFSSNNETAKSIAIDFGAIAILERTRNQTDSLELRNSVEKRIKKLTTGGGRMINTDGSFLEPTTGAGNFIAVNDEYKPTFDMREPEQQRIDPDLLYDQYLDDL